VVRTVSVRAELREQPADDASIDLVLEVFAQLESGEEVVAQAHAASVDPG
jgi:hypothetical protein